MEHTARNRILHCASRLLVGFLLFKAFSYAKSTEAATTLTRGTTCSLASVQVWAQNKLQENAEKSDSSNQEARDWLKRCNQEFLASNSISPTVKSAVDEWLGLDLAKASANQLFWAYQVAIASPKPEKVDEEFKRECDQMSASYDAYRDITANLAPFIQVDPSTIWMEADESNEANKEPTVSEDERKLVNFVEYSRHCNFMSLL